jgi:hypothetical protein
MIKLEDTMTGPSTSGALKDLGIKVKTSHYWKHVAGPTYMLVPNTVKTNTLFVKTRNNKSKAVTRNNAPLMPAYSVAELGIMIPWGFFQKNIILKMPVGLWQVELIDGTRSSFYSEAEARAFYLIDLITTKSVTVDHINHPEKYNAVLPTGKVAPAIKNKEE